MGRSKQQPRGESYRQRIEKKIQRAKQKALIEGTDFIPSFPTPLIAEEFEKMQDVYWQCLRSVSDPRHENMKIYPLDKILHRVLSGFLSGSRSVGILFPKVHAPELKLANSKSPLGRIPTRGAVYSLLRKIEWDQANVALAPLWTVLGYTPELIVKKNKRILKKS